MAEVETFDVVVVGSRVVVVPPVASGPVLATILGPGVGAYWLVILMILRGPGLDALYTLLL